MMLHKVYILALICVASSQRLFPNGTRNKLLWPFSEYSIWNHPICGNTAEYVYAEIGVIEHLGCDEDWFFTSSSSDQQYEWYQPNSWTERCVVGNQYKYPIKIPLPSSAIVPDATTKPYSTPNNAAAILLPDGKSIIQMEPMCHNSSNGQIFGYSSPGNNLDTNNFTNIYGDGPFGGHFGSGLSSIGGTIRLNELLPDSGPIPHALKWELWGQEYYYLNKYSGQCRQWPAVLCDGCSSYCYNGTNPYLMVGSLLAVPYQIGKEINQTLKTIPAKMILTAFVNYGAYIVDNTGWNETQFCVEHGVNEQFNKTYGYPINDDSSPFYADIMTILQQVHIVNNNREDAIGGCEDGGQLLAPLAPPIGN